MKKYILAITLSIVFLFFPRQTQAMTLSPAEGTLPSTGETTINIISTYSTTAARVHLYINNAQITNYTQPSGSVLTVGVCDTDGNKFRSLSATKYELCVEYANTMSTLKIGDSLGSFTIKGISGGGEVSIETADDNGYLNNDTSDYELVHGILGSYSFGSVTALPKTALSDHVQNKGLIGAIILITGFISLALAIKLFLIDKRQEIF